MSIYISPSQVQESFSRLASKTNEGKSHLERTSAILYFLAFDAACHETGKSLLDLNPDRLEGRNNRKLLELEFAKIVLLDSQHGQPIQFLEFGKIDINSIAPEKRISSNFLTVPLKKAATQSEPFFYPRRPKNPLLKLGLAATGEEWGMTYHQDFASNFFYVINSARSSTPAFDLSVLLSRDSTFPENVSDIYDGLKHVIGKRFTSDVSQMLLRRVERERVLLKLGSPTFSDHYSNFVRTYNSEKLSEDNDYKLMGKDDLIRIIHDLESTIESLKKIISEKTI